MQHKSNFVVQLDSFPTKNTRLSFTNKVVVINIKMHFFFFRIPDPLSPWNSHWQMKNLEKQHAYFFGNYFFRWSYFHDPYFWLFAGSSTMLGACSAVSSVQWSHWSSPGSMRARTTSEKDGKVSTPRPSGRTQDSGRGGDGEGINYSN